MPNEQLKLQVVRPGICYGVVRDVVLLHYQESPTVEDLRARAEMVRAVMNEHPKGIAFLSVIDAPLGVAFPGSVVRAETARQLQSLEGVLRCGAVVFTGSAVRVSVAQMLLSRLPKMMRGGAEMRFFTDLEVAAAWCLTHLRVRRIEHPARIRELVSAVAQMKIESEMAWDDVTPTLVGRGKSEVAER